MESFNIENYFNILELEISKILSRKEKDVLTYDILDTEKSKNNKLIALRERQRQMKIGEIWQVVIGNYDGFENLKIGHESGLDIISISKKIVIELKNRTNTDNNSSKKSNLDKLSNFKKDNQEYICIYGNINARTEKTTLKGRKKIIKHCGIEIEHLIGHELLFFIFGRNTLCIINFVKNIIDKYT
jgi:hypothetical protein